MNELIAKIKDAIKHERMDLVGFILRAACFLTSLVAFFLMFADQIQSYSTVIGEVDDVLPIFGDKDLEYAAVPGAILGYFLMGVGMVPFICILAIKEDKKTIIPNAITVCALVVAFILIFNTEAMFTRINGEPIPTFVRRLAPTPIIVAILGIINTLAVIASSIIPFIKRR